MPPQQAPDPGEASARSTEAILALLGRRHAFGVLNALAHRDSVRFTQLQRSLKLTPKTLNALLKAFEREGWVRRQALVEIPPRVLYALTPAGDELHRLVLELPRAFARPEPSLSPEPPKGWASPAGPLLPPPPVRYPTGALPIR
jgi:DNA-binding HxlR family transcriptional regulator